jgi:hypothetical protein
MQKIPINGHAANLWFDGVCKESKFTFVNFDTVLCAKRNKLPGAVKLPDSSWKARGFYAAALSKNATFLNFF